MIFALWMLLIVVYLSPMGYGALRSNLAWVVMIDSVLADQAAPLPPSFGASWPSSHIHLNGMRAYYAGDCAEAKELLERATTITPSNVVLHFFAGNAWYQCGSIDKALLHWRQAGAARHFLWRCEESFRQERLDAVLSQCQIALDIDPHLAWAFDLLGRANSRLRRFQQATEFYERSIALDNTNGSAYLNAATAYRRLGELQIAEQYYFAGIELKPTYAAGHYALGTLYFEQGNYVQAEKYLQEAIQLDDQNATFFVSLGDLYCVLRDPAAAETNYRRAYDLASNNQNILKKLQSVLTECR
jgi:tetratricopeptide (TPR) repeat protein